MVRVLDESDGPSTEHSATPSDESADWDAESSVDGKEHHIVHYTIAYLHRLFVDTLAIIKFIT